MPRKLTLILVATLLLLSLACGTTTTEKLQTAVPTSEPAADESAAVADTDPEDAEASKPEPSAPSEPTSTPKPTASPVAEVFDAVIAEQGFGQSEQTLAFGFVLENPNPGHALEDLEYQAAVYDSDGTVIETDSGYIGLLLPEQRVGFAGTMWLNEGVAVETLEVQLKQGDPVVTDALPGFSTQAVDYHRGEYSDSVTGVIGNPYERSMQNLRVNALLYNAADEIVGGGYTYHNFVLAGSTNGVDVDVAGSGDVARAELHPMVSGLTFLEGEPSLPDGASAVELLNTGGGQDGISVGYAFVLENRNADFSIEGTEYHVTVYGEAGAVLGTSEGYVTILLPEQTLGCAGDAYLATEAEVTDIQIEILTGDFVESTPIPHFTTEAATFVPDQYFPEVTGKVLNPYSQQVDDVKVYAVLYDEAGAIIGGGYTYLDFIPAEGSAAVDLGVTAKPGVASVELYATVSSLSDFD